MKSERSAGDCRLTGPSRGELMLCVLSIALCAALSAPDLSAQRLLVHARQGAQHTVDGLRFDGDRLRGQVAGAAWSLPLRDLWFIRPARRASAKSKAADAAFVLLRKGPRIRGEVTSASVAPGVGEESETTLRFQPTHGSSSELPMRYVQAVRFAAMEFMRKAPKVAKGTSKNDKNSKSANSANATPNKSSGASGLDAAKKKAPTGPADEGFELACKAPPKNNDLLFVYVGDRLRRVPCRVKSIEAGNVIADRGKVPIAKIYGVVFGEISGVEAEPLPSQRRVRVQQKQAGNSRVLEGSLVALDAMRVSFKLDAGVQLDLLWSSLSDVELVSDRLVYLSSLALTRESKAPAALLRSWPLLRDTAPGSSRLRLGERVYRRGFFLVPPRKLVFDLPRKFDRLEGEVGILPSRFGAATLRIFGGDKQIGETISLRPGATPVPIRLALGAATRVTVQIDVGPDLDSGARVILGDFRVIAE